METDVVDSDSSSDDEMLEDVKFLSNFQPTRSLPPSVGPSPCKSVTKAEKAEETIGSKLDDLLTKYKEEVLKDEMHQEMKQRLLLSIEQGSQEENSFVLDESLNGELANHIEDLEVIVPDSKLDLKQTVFVFDPGNYCCLFQHIFPHPVSSDTLNMPTTAMDKVLVSLTPDDFVPLLMSSTLSFCIHQVTDPKSVLIWLLCVASINPSSMVLQLCSHNVDNVLENLDHYPRTEENCNYPWHLSPLEVICIFVNMGANLAHLLGNQRLYTEDIVRESMNKFKEKTDSDFNKTNPSQKLGEENCRHVFEILTKYFQKRPNNYTADELDLMLCVIIKISLDTLFQSLALNCTFQALLSSLLECYKKSDWPSVVPGLCRQLKDVPYSHQSCVYIVEIMPLTSRGIYLQIRLSFIWLCSCLQLNQNANEMDFDLKTVSPSLITRLGHPVSDDISLYSGLHYLLKNDVNKIDSALTLLDRAVGDESNRTMQPKEEMHHLIDQVKLVIRDIRDSIKMLELSKIKDKMTIMSVKWSMTSAQNTKSVQRSIFSWVTSSQAFMPEEKLKDGVSTTCPGDEKVDEQEHPGGKVKNGISTTCSSNEKVDEQEHPGEKLNDGISSTCPSDKKLDEQEHPGEKLKDGISTICSSDEKVDEQEHPGEKLKDGISTICPSD